MPSQDEGTAFSGVNVPFEDPAEARAARAREMEAVVKRILLLLLGVRRNGVWNRLNVV